MTKKNENDSAPEERGCWLSGFLILIMIHGLVFSWLIFDQRQQPDADSPGLLAVLFILAVADIVAAIAIWYWKRWGLTLYAISVAISIAVGLVVFRTQLWVFYAIIPLAIVGYLVKDKWAYFGIETE